MTKAGLQASTGRCFRAALLPDGGATPCAHGVRLLPWTRKLGPSFAGPGATLPDDTNERTGTP